MSGGYKVPPEFEEEIEAQVPTVEEAQAMAKARAQELRPCECQCCGQACPCDGGCAEDNQF